MRPHADVVFSVASHEPALLAGSKEILPAVDLSWRRCLNEFKLDPAREYAPLVWDAPRLKELQTAHEELVQIARAEMDALYEQISGSGYALLLADTSGVILCEKVDPTLKRMFSDAGLIVGAEWSEQREGTNGIGTCAREARPITIHQADHFRTRHTNLSCSAAPIQDHLGNVVAVLDASCVGAYGTREAQVHTVALVQSSARLIEKCLFLRRHHGDALLRFHHRPEFIDLLHDGAIAVAADGTIVAADAMGLKLLGAQQRCEVVGRSINEIFDTSYEELLPAKGSTRRAIWQLRDNMHGRRYYASMIECGSQASPAPRAPAAGSRTIVHVTRNETASSFSLEELAGDDPQMLRNVRNARRIVDRAVSVLIYGATGSGKEVFAKAMHLASHRAKNAFIAVNCAAIPESLIESELFGYGPGAFTGARRTGMRGRIAQSSGGTLFLDEIGDMPLSLQTRLLRVLEEQEVTPLGTEEIVKVNLHVICASHRNLRELVARGEFREDLYYRLNGIMIELPSLAARRDRGTLIRKCIAREFGDECESLSIESAALQHLMAYDWPGNIRELRNAIRVAAAICDGGIIRVSDLPDEIRQYKQNGRQATPSTRERLAAADEPAAASDHTPSFESAERQVLMQSIERNAWVMSRVAAQLGISRNTLYRKLKAHGIALTRPA
jgi:sigma-54 dependent transcriptional regulator, acetoin dehydrogenase operon transcriptional activator AcoR